jgi:hypothetical protein
MMQSMDKLPPVAYSKFERFVGRNWQLILIAGFLSVCLWFAFFYREPAPDYPAYDTTSR